MPSGPEQAVAALAEWEGVGAEQYDEMINRMSVADVALPGSLVHVAGPVANGWRVFDVWESPEALDRFRRGTLMPILELSFALYFTGALWFAFDKRIYTSVPFILLFQLGFLYVGVSSLLQGRLRFSESAPAAVVAEEQTRRAA